MDGPARRATILCALLTSTAIAAPAAAQGGQPSIYQNVDSNGVDMVDGSFNLAVTEATIGSGPGAISLMRYQGVGGESDNLSVGFRRTVNGGAVAFDLTFGNRRETFTGSAGASSWTSAQGNGGTLTRLGASDYRLTAADGTVTVYGPPPLLEDVTTTAFCSGTNESNCSLIARQSTAPSGATLTFQWDTGQNCTSGGMNQQGEPIWNCAQFWRQRGASNNSGYRIRFSFQQEPKPTTGAPGTAWYTRSGATLHNDAVAGSPARTVSYSTPSTGVTDITTDGGGAWRITRDTNQLVTAVRRPGSTANNVGISYSAATPRVVSSVTADGVTTTYARSVSGTTATMTVTNAYNQQTTIVSNLTVGRPTSVTDALDRTTTSSYDSAGRLSRVTAPELNYTEITYDSRGNATQTQQVAKPNSGTAPITTSATYPTTCANVVTCNRPLTTTDAGGHVTDYSYDQTHGGALSVTASAVTVNGASVRPQVRTTYTQVSGIYLPTQTSACRTTASCAGTADEVRSTVVYGTNHLPQSVSSGDGAGTLTATSSMTYDSAGNLLTVDGPLAGSGDTVRYRYDAARRRTGTVTPDPDGTGSLLPGATNTIYRADGQVSRTEIGNVNSQSDVDWATRTVREQVDITYDVNNRPVAAVHGGGGTHSVVQTSYDLVGRPECTAQRMNPANWSSLPPSACTALQAGTNGPDRITGTSRNAAGETVEVRTALGTDAESATTATYTPNGRLLTLTDGENNSTGYAYDGHDRLKRTYFPLAARGSAASNAADYEELGYDSAGNVATRRNRANETAVYSYDALGRTAARNLPGNEPDVAYGYDLLGRMTSASQPGHALAFTYDALGRVTSEAGPLGTVAYAYDLAGNRTNIVHPDGKGFVEWRDLLGRVTLIGEPYSGNNDWIVTRYWYDNAGRRTTTVRAADYNGTTTSFQYNAAGRLQTIGHDLDLYAGDLTLGFTYNPAGQIASNSRTNDIYSVSPAAATTIETPNGLNQLSQRNGATLGYDLRGNLIDDAAGTQYTYDSQNRLVSSTDSNGTVALTYDPLGRLYQQSSGASVRRFLYDGHRLISEHDGASANAMLHRYVHGPGTDEPVAYYQGSALGLAGRTYPHQDERGSVVAVANADGSVNAVNAYDEYGVVHGTLTGRFGYTGQAWLPRLGLYYYRARIYHPRLGRFLQTDPIGYGDGMNMYAYVRGDPVNARDPSGTCGSGTGPPSEAEVAECIAAESARWANYNPGPNPDGAYMASVAIGQIDAFRGSINLLGGWQNLRIDAIEEGRRRTSVTVGPGSGPDHGTGQSGSSGDGIVVTGQRLRPSFPTWLAGSTMLQSQAGGPRGRSRVAARTLSRQAPSRACGPLRSASQTGSIMMAAGAVLFLVGWSTPGVPDGEAAGVITTGIGGIIYLVATGGELIAGCQ